MVTLAPLLTAVVDDNLPPVRDLPEPVRQIAYMALLGIALLGMLIVVVTLLGGHWVRRWGNHTRGPAVPPDVMIPRQNSSTMKSEFEESTDRSDDVDSP